MKKLYLNQKAYLNKEDVYDLILNLRNSNIDEKDFVIFPSSLYISTYQKEGYVVGAQNISVYDDTAQTGELRGTQLRSVGVEYVIIGHSERRERYSENNSMINRKIRNALSNGIIPILCVGETQDERKNGETQEIVKRQIKGAIGDLNINKLIVAYEPIWAIGTGTTPTIDEINKINKTIKDILDDLNIWGNILYGGSVSSKNINELNKTEVDGYLIGGASTKAEEIKAMLGIASAN